MATPTMPVLSEAQAEALSGTIDAGTGIKHQVFGADDQSTPSAFAQLMNLERNSFMQMLTGGKVIWSGSGLTVGAYPLEYELAGTAYSFAGDAAFSLSLPVNDTSYVYLDTDAVLESQVSGWPSGNHFKLAKVTTNATQVTAITDMRLANFTIGVDSAWWTFPPTAEVDFNDQDIKGVRRLGFSAPSTVVLDATGKINLAGQPSLINVDTYAAASSDDLENFGNIATSDKGRIWIIGMANFARWVTIKGTAMTTAYGDFLLDGPSKFICVHADQTDGSLTELFRSHVAFATLSTNLDAQSLAISNVGTFSLSQADGTITDAFAEIAATGIYQISLTAAEMNHDQVVIKCTASGAADSFVTFRMFSHEIDDLLDGNNRVDVGKWLGVAVTNGATSGKPEVDAKAISDSAAAANDLEAKIANLDVAVSTRAEPSDIPSAANNADAVFDEPRGDHNVAGSFGEALNRCHADAANKKIANKFTGITQTFEDDGTTVSHQRQVKKGATDDEVELVPV